MISVIIPSYNRAHLIQKSVASVLQQTYRDLEVIVVDDGSSDNTAEVIGAMNDERVVYQYQKNQGACVARNLGIAVAKGEYIAFQDSDDEWLPDKLEKQKAILDNHPDVDIVCCQTVCRKLDGSAFVSLQNRSDGVIPIEDGPYGISTQTLLVRRNVFDTVKFDPKVTRYQDLDFLLCAIRKHPIYCVAECLVERKHEDDSISAHPERIYDMTVYFQKKHSDIMEDKKQFLSFFLASMLIDASSGNNDRKKYLTKAWQIHPSAKIAIKLILSVLKNGLS